MLWDASFSTLAQCLMLCSDVYVALAKEPTVVLLLTHARTNTWTHTHTHTHTPHTHCNTHQKCILKSSRYPYRVGPQTAENCATEMSHPYTARVCKRNMNTVKCTNTDCSNTWQEERPRVQDVPQAASLCPMKCNVVVTKGIHWFSSRGCSTQKDSEWGGHRQSDREYPTQRDIEGGGTDR